jgi:16S rRNA (cytosine1402-N4)-methyltransferase
VSYEHVPVLLTQTLDALAVKAGGTYADGTLGGGGHASAVCEKLKESGVFLGIDRDREALVAAEERLRPFLCKKVFVHGNFDAITEIRGSEFQRGFDGAMLDLGVSSYQLDKPERGFSYMQDGPLDMRMNAEENGFNAADVVATYSEQDLTRIIRVYGEERWASRIAQFIVRERKKRPICTTGTLSEVIKAAIPASARRDGPHPAKRTFQALRIEVNDELGSLQRGVGAWIDALAPGGRLAVITFHSLEDRIVKDIFRDRENPCTCPPGLPQCVCGKVGDVKRVNRKPIIAGSHELEENPRARSAKLRIVEKKGT